MAIPLDLKLGPDGDLVVAGGDLVIAYDLDGIAQMADLTLSMILGEWFADKSLGVDWFGQVFIKSPDLVAIAAMLRAELLTVPGIVSVASLAVAVNAQRRATVTFTAVTDLGVLTDQTVTVSQ